MPPHGERRHMMKSSLLSRDRYQRNSPSELNGRPRVSLLLRRANGRSSSRRTPVISRAGPRDVVIWLVVVNSFVKTFRSRSSSILPDIRICLPSAIPPGTAASCVVWCVGAQKDGGNRRLIKGFPARPGWPYTPARFQRPLRERVSERRAG
jgi:hypothetical protein